MQLAALARFRAHRSAQQAWHVLRAHARAVAAPARRAREQSEVASGFAEVQAVQEGRDALGRRVWSKPRPVWPARAKPARTGWLAEAGRSLGQPGACSGAERSLRCASWPKHEPACLRHRWRVKELHAQLIVLRGQSVEWVEGDLYGELAPVAAMTPGEHV